MSATGNTMSLGLFIAYFDRIYFLKHSFVTSII